MYIPVLPGKLGPELLLTVSRTCMLRPQVFAIAIGSPPLSRDRAVQHGVISTLSHLLLTAQMFLGTGGRQPTTRARSLPRLSGVRQPTEEFKIIECKWLIRYVFANVQKCLAAS